MEHFLILPLQEVKLILDKEDRENLPYDKQVLKLLQEKGFAVLRHEVTEIRKKLGRDGQPAIDCI